MADGDGIEATGAFGAEFDAAGGAIAVGGDEFVGGVGLVEDGAGVVSADGVILEEDVLGGEELSDAEGAFMTRASSVRELKTELRTVMLVQVSMSKASRLVSTTMLSTVHRSTPVPRMAKWPP